MALIVKGEAVVFLLADGRRVKPPASYGIVHDPEGKVFSKCTIFVGPVRRTGESVGHSPNSRAYFGKKYDLRKATTGRPNGSFKTIGQVVEIRYRRRGRYAGGYYHPFKAFAPTLSRSGRWYKLDLRDGCIVDDRGFVFP